MLARLQRRMARGPVRVRHLALLCLGLAAAPSVLAQAQGEAALKVKIALGLARFAQWPAGSAETLKVCVAQRDPAILQAFAEAEGQVVNGRRVQVVKAPPVAGCQVLFVNAGADRASEMIRAAASTATLVIGDGDGTLAQGGMVELVQVNDSLRFDVNMSAVRRAQLGLSSQVLKLARQVRE